MYSCANVHTCLYTYCMCLDYSVLSSASGVGIFCSSCSVVWYYKGVQVCHCCDSVELLRIVHMTM